MHLLVQTQGETKAQCKGPAIPAKLKVWLLFYADIHQLFPVKPGVTLRYTSKWFIFLNNDLT